MQKENLSFESDFGKIFYALYLPKQANGALIQIAHGMIEEQSKYEEFATFLCQFGYVVAVSDHRGHGKSIGGKSGGYEVEWGEMGEDGFERAVGDLYALSQILKQRFEPETFVLLGHSMGSLLSRRYLQLYEKELDALILMGTPSPNILAGFGAFLCQVLQALGWNRLGARVINLLSFASFNRDFRRRDPSVSSYAWLTRDLAAMEDYKDRGDYRFCFTLNSFRHLFVGLHQVFSPYPHPRNFGLPILFLSGDDDACGGFGEGVYRAYRHLVAQGYGNAELRLYSGARHELLLETNKAQVMREIKEWIDGQIR